MMYDEVVWPKLEKVAKHPLLIPIGSIEQHGLRLPLGVDSFLAKSICLHIKEEIEAVIAPVVTYGARSLPNSGGGDSFLGTIPIKGKILIDYYQDILQGYLNVGFKTIIIINAHWENEVFLQEAVERLKEKKQLEGHKVFLVSWWSVLNENYIEKILPKFAGWKFEHAGRAEMALMLYYYPDLVGYSTNNTSVDLDINADIYTYPVNKRILNNYGSLSACEGITKEMGEQLAHYLERSLLNELEDFLKDDDR